MTKININIIMFIKHYNGEYAEHMILVTGLYTQE